LIPSSKAPDKTDPTFLVFSQCEDTNLFFFDSNNDRPLSVLFLPSSQVPDSLRSGTITVDQAQQYSPLLALDGITTPDAAQYNFQLQIAEGEAFEVSWREENAIFFTIILTFFRFNRSSVSSPTVKEKLFSSLVPSRLLFLELPRV